MRLLFLMTIALLIIGCTSQETPIVIDDVTQSAPPIINPLDAELVTAQKNYDLYCAHCHGYTGGGQPTGGGPGSVEFTREFGYHTVPRHDAVGHTWQHADQVLFEVIKYGVESPLSSYKMSGYGVLISDDEIWGLIEYIKLFWTDEQRKYQAEVTETFAERRPEWTENSLETPLE